MEEGKNQLLKEIHKECIKIIEFPNQEEKKKYILLFKSIQLPISIRNINVEMQWYTYTIVDEEIVDLISRSSDLNTLENLIDRNYKTDSIFVYGDIQDGALLRVHSGCVTGDIFGSLKCDCGPQLYSSFQQIIEEGAGILFYISRHEGRGIGLFPKAITYVLQERGLNTYEANEILGLRHDYRDFSEVPFLLKNEFSLSHVRVLTNNPLKLSFFEGSGVTVEQVKMSPSVNKHNEKYLKTKAEGDHTIDFGDLSQSEEKRKT